MEDDEDLIDERSPLHQHLSEVGFMVTNDEAPVPVRTPPRPRQTLNIERKKTEGGTIDHDVLEEVLTLRAANLLFQEDTDHVDSIFANYELAKQESYKYMFKSTASYFVITIGLFLYVYMGIYAFFFMSIFYAYRMAEHMWNKYIRLKRWKRLMKVLQSNFAFLVRLLKFVYENENILKNRFGADSSHRAFIVLAKVKSDLIDIQQDINNTLAGATLTLLHKVPLCDYVENPECYVCQNTEYYKSTKLTQLHNVYMLLQSQFLTRLIFSIVPNLLAINEDPLDTTTDVVQKVTKRFHEVHHIMTKKFKFVLTNGIYVDDSMPSRRLPTTIRRSSIGESTVKYVHELSNSLQFSLIKSRELENCLHFSETINSELELTTIRKELSSCLLLIEDILTVSKKNKTGSVGKTKTILEKDVADDDVNFTELGYPSVDPEVGDDIFEGSTATDSVQDDSVGSGYDYEDDIDVMAKQHHQYVLVELKTRLKQQAEEWARREALVRERKGMDPPESPNDDEERMFRSRLNRTVKKSKYRHRTESNSSRKKYEAEKARFSQKGSSFFATTIEETRAKIGATVIEESYCGSGENSHSDDEI